MTMPGGDRVAAHCRTAARACRTRPRKPCLVSWRIMRMTPAELANVLAYLSAAVSKPVEDLTAEAYRDVLGHLPANVVQEAAREVIRHHVYACLPTPGALY